MKQVTIQCELFFDTRDIVSYLVGDDVSFTYRAETNQVFIKVEDDKAALEMERRVMDYDLDGGYEFHVESC
jgi:hypothetical protein